MIGGAIVTILVTWHVCQIGGSEDFIPVNITEGSGSGQEDVTIWSNDLPPLSSDIDFLRSTTQKTVTKRATGVFYNGRLERRFYSIFSYSNPLIPPTAIIPLNRPLQRGKNIPQLQYIALWTERGKAPHWGVVQQNAAGKLDGSFIKDRRIHNLSAAENQNIPVRLVQYVGDEHENNFRFAWTKALDADMATVVSEREWSNKCSPRMAPAVLQDHGFEFLGEADIDNRVMYYVDHNIVNTVSGADSGHRCKYLYGVLMSLESCGQVGSNGPVFAASVILFCLFFVYGNRASETVMLLLDFWNDVPQCSLFRCSMVDVGTECSFCYQSWVDQSLQLGPGLSSSSSGDAGDEELEAMAAPLRTTPIAEYEKWHVFLSNLTFGVFQLQQLLTKCKLQRRRSSRDKKSPDSVRLVQLHNMKIRTE